MPFEASSRSQSEAIQLLKKRLSGFETEEGRLKGLNYRPRSNDIAISTTPKAGTTWMQQICHQLRSRGDMNFEEISEVVPWLELAHDQGQDLEAPQFGHPKELRFFKTHAWEGHCPPFAKVIVVLRDPCDVLLSFYKFFEGWFFEFGEISLEAFADEFWLARGTPSSKMENASYFVHLTSWYKRRNDESVLIVFFEDLKEDLAKQIQRVSSFLSTSDGQLGYDTRERMEAALKFSSFEFMKQNQSKFDEKLSKRARNEACGLSAKAGLSFSKIRHGEVGSGSKTLPESIQSKIEQKWKEVVLPVTGCKSYDELRQQLAKSDED